MQLKLARLTATVAAAVVLAALPGVADAAVTWTVQSVPLPPNARGGELSAVDCPASAFCVATDSADGVNSSGYLVPVIEVWNGSTWTAQVLPEQYVNQDATVTAVSCASTTSCVATGSYANVDLQNMMAEVWNGSTWTLMTLPEPPNSYQDGVLEGVSCASATNCTAVGSYGSPSSSAVGLPLAEHWNGSTWKVQTPPAPAGSVGGGLSGISCPTASSCTAVGAFQNGHGYAPFIERWNGSTWKVELDSLPAGDTGAGLSAVSCTSASSCFAAGSYTTGATSGAPLALRYSHGSWTASQPPIPSATTGSLTGISCVTTAAGSSHCTAVGAVTESGTSGGQALAEYWNGRRWAWQATAAPPSRKSLAAVSCAAGGTCIAVGRQLPQGARFYQMLAEQN